MLVKDIKSTVNRAALCSDFDTSICMDRVSEGIEIQLTLNIVHKSHDLVHHMVNFRKF